MGKASVVPQYFRNFGRRNMLMMKKGMVDME